MSLLIDPPFGLGQTLGVTGASDGLNWVGVVKLFPDDSPITGRKRSNRVKRCIAVKNSSGVTLYGKRGVDFAAGSFSAVSGYHRTDGTASQGIAGVADEYLPATGVAPNDVFWVTVEGPTEILVGAATSPDDLLVAATAATTASTLSTSAGGYAATANATTAQGIPALGVVYGRACSTATSGSACLAIVGPRGIGGL
ncbi:MAG: hypothetical protein EBT03_07655 [Betaproteobacteria bacterium]|nr:hypothetical protein [Betaproteobacteria bacterium]NCA16959.1 hypothetical protein [Betaproteobacteria bacterium]